MTTIYFTLVIILLLAMFMCSKKDRTLDVAFLITCFIIMTLLHTFINPEYSDLYGYKIGFNEYHDMPFFKVFNENAPSLKAEIGYRVFCKVITLFTSEWRWAMFLISIVILSGYYYAVKHYSTMFWLSILLIMVGPFSQSLFVLRQHMAMGIILFTYPFIIEKKIVPYIVICLLAFLLHQSALIFVPVYFIYNMRNNYMVQIVFIMLFFVLFYYYSNLLSATASVVMNTASYSDSFFEYNSDGQNAKTAYLLSAVTILRYFLLRKDFLKEGINKLISIILIMGTILSFVGVGYMGTGRLNMYYTATSFLFIPNTLQYLKRKDIRVMLGFSYFLFLLYFFVRNANSQDMSDFWFFYKYLSL